MDQPSLAQPRVNLLHPLTSLEWRDCSEISVGVCNAQAVLFGSKVYIGGGGMNPGSPSRLLIYDYTKNLWDILDTPTQWYALTTYHSQLVLVGGVDPNTRVATNQLWVLDEQHHWTQPLPPMTTKRRYASAVSVGDHLIVAGGCVSSDFESLDGVVDMDAQDVVEVYNGHQWRQVQSLPKACFSMKSTFLEGDWYLAGGMGQGCKVYHTSLECLIATSEEAVETSVWKKLPDVPLKLSTPVVLRNNLITIGYYYNSAIQAYVYSPNTNCWVHVGELPVSCYFPCSLVLPTGELLVIGETKSGLSSCLYRADLTVTSFPDGHFNISALHRLEKTASISMFDKLVPKFLELSSALDFDDSTLNSLKEENNPVEGVNAMLKAWLSGKSSLPPTWQMLLKMFHAIDMGGVAQEIEHFFNSSSVTSLSVSLKGDLELDVSEIESKERLTKPDCRDVAVQTHGKATAAETIGYLRGLDVIAETSVLVTNQSQTFHWTGYGLKLHIPQGALPACSEKCRLLIKVGLSGQFALPQNTSLVSAVYWLDSEPRLKFSQPLTLEIQHCAKATQTSRLSFALAKCSKRNLPYTFELQEEGKFSSLSAYGCIQLDHFSLITLVKRLILGEDNVSYRASLYYLKKGVNRREIHFVITKNQEPHTTVVQQKYTAKHAIFGPDLPVEFESNSISLQLPSKEEILNGGWRLIPLFHPRITKEDVDNFETRKGIPSCQLTAMWTKQSKPSQLIHQVILEGAKEPSNYFSIILDCDSIPPGGDSTPMPDQDLSSKYPAGLESEPELPDLMNEVAAEIPNRWRDIGIQLGVDHGVLEGIATISLGDTNQCYSNVFVRWKNQHLDAHPYTWSTIVHALESQAVGEKRLASRIKNKLTGHPLQ